jgi:hypothetical protein
MRANLREIIFPFNFYRGDDKEIIDCEKNAEEKTEANTSDTEESERDIMSIFEMYMRIKLPPNRNIIIPLKPDQEVKSDYDFTIIIRINNKGRIEETRIPCHKSILSSKSEMFRAMFSVQMKENVLNEMVTDNIYYKDFIEYLYTCRIQLNKENIIPLVELARMHFIKDLEYKILAYIHMHKEQMDIERCVLEKYDLLL